MLDNFSWYRNYWFESLGLLNQLFSPSCSGQYVPTFCKTNIHNAAKGRLRCPAEFPVEPSPVSPYRIQNIFLIPVFRPNELNAHGAVIRNENMTMNKIEKCIFTRPQRCRVITKGTLSKLLFVLIVYFTTIKLYGEMVFNVFENDNLQMVIYEALSCVDDPEVRVVVVSQRLV